MEPQTWERIVGLPDQGEIEVDRLRAEVRRLRAQLDRVTRERDGYRASCATGSHLIC